LLKDGHAAAVIELCESGLQSLLSAIQQWTIPTATSACCGTGCRKSITGRARRRAPRFLPPCTAPRSYLR
jgi:hypothetical protein